MTLFSIIILILILSFHINQGLNILNARHFRDSLPKEINDVFDQKEYIKSQEYKFERFRLGVLSSTISLIAILLFFFLDGFAYVDHVSRNISDNSIIVALLFFGIIMIASDVLGTPFNYYNTFVIEEKYGFNKTSKATFFIDKLKAWLLGAILGSIFLGGIIWFYEAVGKNFWLYAWGIITIFTLLMNMFYASLIVPLFNKQTPLENGELRNKIEKYTYKVGFHLNKIYIIDGSKRSTKANAYFSGLGHQKRITLYDTLKKDLEDEEILAVLAHEVGHYKHNHILINLFVGIVTTGFTLWLLSLFVDSQALADALKVPQASFHVGLIAFGILYSPISSLSGLFMNHLSRKFEYQADNYAKESLDEDSMISALKKLSKSSLSNLTPHPLYVWAHYSHPTLLQRIHNLKRSF